MVFDHDYKKYPELTEKQLQEFGFSSPHKQITEDFRAKVVKVHDGDTVTLRTDFRDFDFPLRLVDIDAPELNNGGDVARDWLIERVQGEIVMIGIDRYKRVGKYGRLLGRITQGGTDVGQEEIYLGLAVPFGSQDEGEIPDPNKTFMLRKWL